MDKGFFLRSVVFYFLLATFLSAGVIDINQSGVSLLKQSEVYIDQNDYTLTEIIDEALFQPYNKDFIRTGVSKKKVWIKLDFTNNTDQVQEKILLFGTPFIEHIHIYDETNLSKPYVMGQAHPRDDHKTQLHYYKIRLEPYDSQIYYLTLFSNYNYLNFELTLEDEISYLEEDRVKQFINIFLVGFIFALMTYSFLLSFYIKDKSYFFYGLYLVPLLSYQLKYVGLTQIYFSKELIMLDLEATIIRGYLLMITNALFAMHFLDIRRYQKLYRTFVIYIVTASICMVLFYEADTIGYRLSSLFALFLVILNLSVAIYVYRKGYKQARLYITGFFIVFLSYIGVITDSMGLTTLFVEHNNLFLFAVSFEAIVFSLAFADRYVILQKEKEKVNRLSLEESHLREERINAEVEEKTKQLSDTLKSKELLLREVHHRVKNNLQVLLSLIKLQKDGIQDQEHQSTLNDIGNRVNAIAKSYEMLTLDENLDQIDMKLYMESLAHNLYQSFLSKGKNIGIVIDVNVMLSIKEAVYIGLVANEIITNSHKYAFDEEGGKIFIRFHQCNGKYRLIIEDNGKGFDRKNVRHSLGLKLINILVLDQLRGGLEIDTTGRTKYDITFTLPPHGQQT
ncbi:MAG: 7TM diverse intracellular signaling domain-containing protein [Sulfurimonas sp.]